jgi:hypothetical protein
MWLDKDVRPARPQMFPAIARRRAETRAVRGFQTHRRLRYCQPSAVQIQVHQSKAGAHLLMVLLQAQVSHFLEAKDTLQDPSLWVDLQAYPPALPKKQVFLEKSEMLETMPKNQSVVLRP